MATLASPTRALIALLRTRWRNRKPAPAQEQIIWGLNYIREHYSSPAPFNWHEKDGKETCD